MDLESLLEIGIVLALQLFLEFLFLAWLFRRVVSQQVDRIALAVMTQINLPKIVNDAVSQIDIREHVFSLLRDPRSTEAVLSVTALVVPEIQAAIESSASKILGNTSSQGITGAPGGLGSLLGPLIGNLFGGGLQ